MVEASAFRRRRHRRAAVPPAGQHPGTTAYGGQVAEENVPSADRLVEFGRQLHRLYLRIAAGGSGPEPVRPGDHATQVDRDLETALANLVQERFGTAGVVAEERVSDGAGVLNPDAPLRAYIDPIDGTHLYNRGAAGFTSTVALEYAGRLAAGLICIPSAGVLRVARRGEPARTVALGPPAAAGPGLPAGRRVVAVKSGLRRSAPAIEPALRQRGYQVENLGSAAGRLDALAAGRIAGLVKDVGSTGGVPRLWGVAAGLLLCAGAGIPMFWDEENHILVAGETEIADALAAGRIGHFAARDLDSLWHAMKACDRP
jgi:fructose-1,6-bisphosphatase/inositol monophosphatase family enzyme